MAAALPAASIAREFALRCGGALAQGRGAKAAGKRAVIIGGDSSAPIQTGSRDNHRNLFPQAARPGASAADLRMGYLAWVSLRANEPLLANVMPRCL
jgi:hypothetical protein